MLSGEESPDYAISDIAYDDFQHDEEASMPDHAVDYQESGEPHSAEMANEGGQFNSISHFVGPFSALS